MKKILTLLAATALSISFLSAQPARRAVGDLSMDLGVGFKSTAQGYSTLLPPVDASLEYTVLDFGTPGTLSVGGSAMFALDKYEGFTFSSLFIGPQVTYRFPVLDKLDLFGKTAMGFYAFHTTDKVFDEYLGTNGFAWAAYIGATYYLSEKIGVGLQFGSGLSTAEIHVTIQL